MVAFLRTLESEMSANNRTPLVVEGVLYPSIAAAWRKYRPRGVSEGLVRVRLTDGWTPERALTQPIRGIRCVVDGIEYASIKIAHQMVSPEGLKYGTVLNRIDRGWEPWRALKVRCQS